ncbi:photosystem reaction center subunit H [Salinimicrobium terrae]|uniref:photosystem reaction center subunit H n=1 Tax=Salinimicrobium terrae TaxID=470866 RepID=UPI00042A7A48|nr:photosystem reaction center subunit H [Salinimicrobium terrae]
MSDRKENRKHLFYLHELSDFKVDSDDPDVRGWSVKDVDNKVVGKVDNLLVSKEKKRVVYLDIEVDKSIIDANHDPYGKPASGDVHEFINKEGENHLILPVGLARLNVDDKFVYTDKIDHRTFAETKRVEKGYDVDREYEVVVLESYNRDDRQDRDEERRVVKDTDKERSTSDRDRTLTDRDRGAVDRDRDPLTGNESGKYSDRRNSGTIPEDDSFYDRGEFDQTKYRR